MTAAVLYTAGQPLEIEQLELPPLQPGQVLVELAFSGVCRSQLMEVRGARGVDRWLPHLLGHEGSGTVLEIGEGVTKVRPGEQVILTWIAGAGANVPGGRYIAGARHINAGPVTTFATHAIVSENRVVPLPDGVPLDVAVLFGCALPTGAGMMINEVRPAAGSRLAVFGLGGVGLSALMATRLFECAAVIAVDVSDAKLETARLFGATHVIDARTEDPVAVIRDVTGGGADVAIEAAGRVETIEQAFASVRPRGGFCLFASHPEAGRRIAIDPHDLISGKRIAGSWGGGADPERDVPALARLYQRGSLPLERLIARRYPLEAVNDALADIERHDAFRPLLVMQ